MSNSFCSLRGGRGGWVRVAAIPFFFALTSAAPATEFDDVFEVASLSEVEEPAADDEATLSECWDAAEEEMLNSPCECDHYDQGCNCSPSLVDQMTAMAKSMAAQGIVYAPELSQYYQGVTHGGQEEGFEYGGKVDQFFIFDGGKLCGWEGFSTTMHVETRFGDDVNREAVGLAPVNVAMLYPNADEHDTAITGLLFDQVLDEEYHVTLGKYNGLDMFYGLYPQTGRGVKTFMNASMVIPLSAARVVPLSFMGVGVTKYYEKKPQVGVMVFDNQNVATTSGFDDMFENGANIMGFYRYFTNMRGLPGSHYFGGIWATGEYASFDPTSFAIVPGQGLVIDRQGGAFTLIYILEQTLWADCCNKNRNIGLFSQWGLSDEETSPFGWTCNIAIQATGMNRSRPEDSMGVGYFHSGLSDDFVNALAPVFDLHDVNGVELYYNAAVSKCFHLTADFQIVEPAEEPRDTALVFGLRGVVGL